MKKIIKNRVLECVIEQQKNLEYSKMFPHNFDVSLSKSIELREKYKDLIPLTAELKQDALDYINALNAEDYETCNNFLVV